MMESRWEDIEEELLAYYENENQELTDSSVTFLKRINFVNEHKELTGIGKQYLDSKFIFENGEHKSLLRTQLLNQKEIRELCQSFYGQQTKRENVERFFKSKTQVSDNTTVGRLLGILNKVGILSYSKRKGTVQFKETDQVEEENQESYRVTHRTPYSNLVRFRKAIRVCSGDLLWVSKHFTKKGLEPLAEEVTGEKFETVRILCGPADVDTHLRDDFKRFKDEMDKRDIDTTVRVITEKEKLRQLHDRWLLSSEGASWNVPPINSIYGNQESEMHQTKQDVDFEDWWDDAKDIMSDWNRIQAYI